MFGFNNKKTKTDYSSEPRLVDEVKKNEDNGYGPFLDINNDLGIFVEKNPKCANMLLMSYAYARRTAVAGMVLQGIMKQADYDYVYKVFNAMQVNTEHSKEFQEAAAQQAYELIFSYTNLFNKEGLSMITSVVHQGNALVPPNGETIDINVLAKIIADIKNKSNS